MSLPPLGVPRSTGAPPLDLPPLVDTSPKLPPVRPPNTAQRYLENKDRKLFDSADYFLSNGQQVESSSRSAFEIVSDEAKRLHEQEPRSSNLSFEFFSNNNNDDTTSINSEDMMSEEEEAKKFRQQHHMRRGSMEEFFVEENQSEAVRHAILEKPKLKRWDSGDFYKAPDDYRRMLATQAKEVLKNALDHAEEDHRPRRPRRSSLAKEADS